MATQGYGCCTFYYLLAVTGHTSAADTYIYHTPSGCQRVLAAHIDP